MADFSYLPDFSSDRRPSWDFQLGHVHETLPPRFSLNPALKSVDPLVLQAVELASSTQNVTIGEMLDHLIAAEARPARAKQLQADLQAATEQRHAAQDEIMGLQRQLDTRTQQRDNCEQANTRILEARDSLAEQLHEANNLLGQVRNVLAMAPQRGTTPPRSRAEQIVMLQQLFEHPETGSPEHLADLR